ncbi:MAG: hypothetical protein AAGF12_13210, partial [Myxococcota bacterium]
MQDGQPQGLAPSPIARMLLDLAERGVEGSVVVGGRRVVLRGRSVVDVLPGENDDDLGEFLVRASRITARELAGARADAKATGEPLSSVLRRLPSVGDDTLSTARRAVWLDRLVRGIGVDEERRQEPAPFVPDPPSGQVEGRVALVPLILDALARRANHRDAELVGASATFRFTWEDGPHREEAERWAGLADLPGPQHVARLLSRTPAAAPRIAALIRAGLAYLMPPRSTR